MEKLGDVLNSAMVAASPVLRVVFPAFVIGGLIYIYFNNRRVRKNRQERP